jgi:hypothetical protein
LWLVGIKKWDLVFTTYLWEEAYSGNLGPFLVCKIPGVLSKKFNRHAGSGSSYVYGYCDATYQEGWNKDQTIEFVKNSM